MTCEALVLFITGVILKVIKTLKEAEIEDKKTKDREALNKRTVHQYVSFQMTLKWSVLIQERK